MGQRTMRQLIAAFALASAVPVFAQAAQHDYRPNLHPVATISDTRFAIDTPQGHAQFPLYLSADWNVPQPRIERAVIVIHGKLRNADTYFKSSEKARDLAGASPDSTLLIAPQFLATVDTQVRSVPADLLRWKDNAWMGGEGAEGSVPVSSYAVLDAIVERLADRRLFPNLKHVTFAGHSGGAQVVQRYAIAAHDLQVLTDEGIDVRYVVSSPSSYAYFNDERPNAQNVLKPFDAATCPSFDAWKYGMGERPAYVADRTPVQLEAAYAKRRVDYLVGGADDDPQHPALDKSCAAEAQGSQRLARATAYFAYLQARHPDGLNQSFHVVPGVGHNGARMLRSPCALAAMFGAGQCTP
ncbi:alpha/beta hydrolase [Paraburkholderia sp.]|uniref:alpha/beta hydrolase n=1 Tax=Paraburkholderia sp. TaxID=1926495 RepID=UPI003D6E9C7D